MLICRVVGVVVSTIKDDSIQGMKLLLLEQISDQPSSGQAFVAVDPVGAGEGDLVFVATGGGAREMQQTKGKSIDAAVVGIVDSVSSKRSGTPSRGRLAGR